METYQYYDELIKPSFAPPDWIFGPVWSVLYLIIAITFGYVFYQVIKKKIPKLVALPFILNLVFNFAFTYIQFGLKSNILSSIDIILVLVTLVWAMWSIYPYKKTITYWQIPYLLWVSFATILQLSITILNLKDYFYQ